MGTTLMPYTIEAPTEAQASPSGGKYTIEPPATAPAKAERAAEFGVTLPDTPPPSVGERFLHGVAQPFYGAAQIGARMQEPSYFAPTADEKLTESVDKTVREREASYQQRRSSAGQKGIDLPELGGEVVGQALNPFNYLIPAAGAETALGRVALSALSGAGSSLFNPTTSEDSFWVSKAKQAVGGAAMGGAIGAAAQPIASVAAPHLREAADKLARAGVQLTPGQMTGGLGRFLEDRVLRNFPVLGYFVHGAQDRSIEDFNRALAHQVLEPIGKTITSASGVGTDLVEHVAREVSNAYNEVLPMMRLQPNADFQNRMLAVAQNAQTLTPAAREQFRNTVSNLFAPHLQKPEMSGEEINKITSELGQKASQYRKSAIASEQDLGRMFGAAKGAIEDSLETQNSAPLVKALQNIRASYSMLVRMEDAAGRRTASQGIFTPNDLLAAIKKQDASTRKRDFAHGDALLQPFAEAAQSVLPSKLADSGTTQAMSHIAAAAGLGGGGHMLGTMMPAEAIIGGAAASPIYSRPGIAALNWLFGPSRASSEPARRAIERTYPFGAAIAGGPAADAMGLQ